MKVLISSAYLGGAGGVERAMFSILSALAEDDVDVVVRRRLGGHLSEVAGQPRVHTIRNWRWRGASRQSGLPGFLMQRVVNPVRRRLLPEYDLYLQLFHGISLTPVVKASVKLLVPAGNSVSVSEAEQFDHVALEAPGNTRFVPPGFSSLLLPPPVLPLSDESVRPAVPLPKDYFLTVFNPYSPLKGSDDLRRALSSAPFPVVWCHSQRTLSFEIPSDLAEHPRIIHVDDPTPAEMRYLYENSRAYLSFSRSEGFGWSIADALRYSRAVVSRRVGVLSFEEATALRRVVPVSEPWSVDWSSIAGREGEPDAALAWLSPERFRERLAALVASEC